MDLKAKCSNAISSAETEQCDEKVFVVNGSLVCPIADVSDEAEKQAHLSRNTFQKNVCPVGLPDLGSEVTDPSTGIHWSSEGLIGDIIGLVKGYHLAKWTEVKAGRLVEKSKREDCYRGKESDDSALKSRCDFRRSARAIGAVPDVLSPGYQCCYFPVGHPRQGELSDSGTFDFSSPTFNPWEDKTEDHQRYDVDLHKKYETLGESYDFYEQSSGQRIVPFVPEATPTPEVPLFDDEVLRSPIPTPVPVPKPTPNTSLLGGPAKQNENPVKTPAPMPRPTPDEFFANEKTKMETDP